MDGRQLEQEYKKLKQQAAPDLWARIEANLAEHPERELQNPEESGNVRAFPQRRHWQHTAALAAAAAVVLLVAVPARERLGWNLKGAGSSMMSAQTTAAAAAMDMELALDEAEAAECVPEAAECAPETIEECAPADAVGQAERSMVTHGEPAVPAAGRVPAALPAGGLSESGTAATVFLTGTVLSVSDAEDADGRGLRVAYEIRAEQPDEAGTAGAPESPEAGLPAAGETVTVYRGADDTSDGGQEGPVQGGTYLLTLVQEDGDWILEAWEAVKQP